MAVASEAVASELGSLITHDDATDVAPFAEHQQRRYGDQPSAGNSQGPTCNAEVCRQGRNIARNYERQCSE